MNNRIKGEYKYRVWDNKYKGWMMNLVDFYDVEFGRFIAAGGRGYNIETLFENETMTDEIHEEIAYNGTNPRWRVERLEGDGEWREIKRL